MKLVLVTGGAGFSGANLAHHLLASDATAGGINSDALCWSRANPRDLRDFRHHEFVHGDIANGPLGNSSAVSPRRT